MNPDLEALDNVGVLVNNHYVVAELQKAIIAAPRDISRVRGAVLEVLRRDPPAFVDRVNPDTGARFNRYSAEQFVRFITDPLPEGLESDVATVGKLLEGDAEAYTAFVLALDRGRGGANNPGGKNQHTEGREVNVREPNIDQQVSASEPEQPKKPPRGGTDDHNYAIRRLSRERPDLLGKVKSGELSAHKAMVEAGFRKVPTILDVLRRAWARATPADRAQFLQEVT